LFPNVHGGRLSADSVQTLLAKHVQVASEHCPSLKSKRVSPHVLRHSAAGPCKIVEGDQAATAIRLQLSLEGRKRG
jgi:site-specific recombinase XerC